MNLVAIRSSCATHGFARATAMNWRDSLGLSITGKTSSSM